jgi:hypothetical protein
MIDYTFEEVKNKTVFIKLEEDDDESTEYFEVNTIEDYHQLEIILGDYIKQEILNEYFIYEN